MQQQTIKLEQLAAAAAAQLLDQFGEVWVIIFIDE
jgi:hypothetical protein